MSTLKGWIQSYTGRAVTPLAIEPGQICVEDIAHALANKCRYTGHVPRFDSVAEHSVKGAEVFVRLGRRDLALAFLFHDAAEAYLPDIASPIKGSFFVRLADGDMHAFAELEGYVLRRVAQALGLHDASPFDDPAVRDMDIRVLLAEKQVLFPVEALPWGISGIPAPVQIECWGPAQAEIEFMRVFRVLTEKTIAEKKQKRGRK